MDIRICRRHSLHVGANSRLSRLLTNVGSKVLLRQEVGLQLRLQQRFFCEIK